MCVYWSCKIYSKQGLEPLVEEVILTENWPKYNTFHIAKSSGTIQINLDLFHHSICLSTGVLTVAWKAWPIWNLSRIEQFCSATFIIPVKVIWMSHIPTSCLIWKYGPVIKEGICQKHHVLLEISTVCWDIEATNCNRITESQTGWGWKEPLEYLVQPPSSGSAT